MTNGEAVIAKLISEVADLTKANELLHGIVSNREEEISGLRAQLAQSEERVSKLQAHPGERYWEGRWRDADRALASARNALEAALPIVSDRCAGGRMITPREDASKAFYLIQSALSDDTGQS